jgi:hypothetical protein
VVVDLHFPSKQGDLEEKTTLPFFIGIEGRMDGAQHNPSKRTTLPFFIRIDAAVGIEA